MAKIVVADDDPDIRDLVVYKLEQSGHEVVAVGDGASAVAACREERPDLAVLDVMMPGMSGLDACRLLRVDEDLSELRVILLTARTQEGDLALGREAGADAYIAKPFSPRDLAARVARLLQQPRR